MWTFQALLTRWDFLQKLGFVTFLNLWLFNLIQKNLKRSKSQFWDFGLQTDGQGQINRTLPLSRVSTKRPSSNKILVQINTHARARTHTHTQTHKHTHTHTHTYTHTHTHTHTNSDHLGPSFNNDSFNFPWNYQKNLALMFSRG